MLKDNYPIKPIMKNCALFILICSSLISCAQDNNTSQEKADSSLRNQVHLDSLQTAYFASGCFWCVEAIYESVEGVEEAVSGYSGGKENNPTYEQVSNGMTGHAETVRIYYDSSKVSFATLVIVFFDSHDPSTLNQQGPDRGTQYRSIAFYQNEREKEIIEKAIDSLMKAKVYSNITTQVVQFEKFWEAEAYHQNYEKNHPENSYIRNVSRPRINLFKKKRPEVLKKEE